MRRSWETIDRGNARSIPDLLRLEHGYAGDANMIAAACLAISRICVENPETAKKSTMPQTVAVLGRWSAGLKYVSEERPTTVALRGALICGSVAFAYGVKPKVVAAFYDAFKTGAGLNAGSPVLTLRNHVLQNGPGRSVANDSRTFCDLVLHTLYAFMRGDAMVRIPSPGERTGAQWWRDQQAENIEFVRALFPVVLKAKPVKPNLSTGAVKRHMGTARPRPVTPPTASAPNQPPMKAPVGSYIPTKSREESPDLEKRIVTLEMNLTVDDALAEWLKGIEQGSKASRARQDALHRRYKMLSACEEHGDDPSRLPPVTFEDLVPKGKAVAARTWDELPVL